MKSTPTDPMVAEVRAVRDEYATRDGHDVAAMFSDFVADRRSPAESIFAIPLGAPLRNLKTCRQYELKP